MPVAWKKVSTPASSHILSMRYFAPSGSMVGCQWRRSSFGSCWVEAAAPMARARSMNSSQTPRVTSVQRPPSPFTPVASTIRTMPFVKRPPREPLASTSATFAPARAAATAAANPAGPPPTTTTSVSWKRGTSRAGMNTLPSRRKQLGPSSTVCGIG